MILNNQRQIYSFNQTKIKIKINKGKELPNSGKDKIGE